MRLTEKQERDNAIIEEYATLMKIGRHSKFAITEYLKKRYAMQSNTTIYTILSASPTYFKYKRKQKKRMP